MEDSLRGVLIVCTIIGLFITAIINFIIIFPQEQGVSINDLNSANAYLIINNSNLNNDNSLQTINNQSENAFNQWDVTTGFMGTNQLKQGQSGIKSYSSNVFTNLILIAKKLFSDNSPIVYALGILSLLTSGYILYLIIKFVRTGN